MLRNEWELIRSFVEFSNEQGTLLIPIQMKWCIVQPAAMFSTEIKKRSPFSCASRVSATQLLIPCNYLKLLPASDFKASFSPLANFKGEQINRRRHALPNVPQTSKRLVCAVETDKGLCRIHHSAWSTFQKAERGGSLFLVVFLSFIITLLSLIMYQHCLKTNKLCCCRGCKGFERGIFGLSRRYLQR